MSINKVTLIGLGAMGAFLAPRLEAYLEKGNFRVMAEGERYERLKERGVTINGICHHFPLIRPDVADDPADLIIVAVKEPALNQAIRDIRRQIAEHTQILCIMNGIDSEERIAAVYGWEHVLYSYMRVSIAMKDGVTDYNPELGRIYFGEARNETLSGRVLTIKALMEAAKIPYSIEKDMIRGIWYKFMTNIGENMTCALLGVPYGAFGTSRHGNEIRRRAMLEVVKIAKKKGINLTEADMEKQEEALTRIAFGNKPSTLQDLENKRKTEVDMFAGKVVQLGMELGIDTPLNWMFYHGIKVLEEKNEGNFEINGSLSKK